MTKEAFEAVLKGAISGNNEDLDILLKLYEPLIRRHCYVNGVLDEDLRQYIWIHIALNIGKFLI